MIHPDPDPEQTHSLSVTTHDQILTRCVQLGLAATIITQEPPLGMGGARSVASVTDCLHDAAEGVTVECKPGVRGARLPLMHRGQRLGELLVAAHEVPPPGSSCRPVTRETFETILPILGWLIEDSLHSAEAEHDIEDLAEQLTGAYETLDLMYTLGKSMSEIDRPEQFILRVCARVRRTLGLGYVAVHIPKDAHVGDNLAGRTLWDGSPGETGNKDALDRLLAMMSRVGEVMDAFKGPQAIVRPLLNDQGVVGMIVAGDKLLEGGNISSYDTQLVDAVGGLLATFLTNSRLYEQQRLMVMGVLEALSAAIDAKDPYTRGHTQRVALLSEQISQTLGFDEAAAERMRIAGLLHDVGKIGVPEHVLCKSGKLTDEEYAEIKKHPEIGFRILKDLSWLQDVLPAVLYHHERLDGRGYPSGLKGDDIPLNAKIVAAADTFDAMSSTRSYRSKMPREEVLAEIQRSTGSQLDPVVVDALLSLDLSAFDRMVEEHSRLSDFSNKAA